MHNSQLLSNIQLSVYARFRKIIPEFTYQGKIWGDPC